MNTIRTILLLMIMSPALVFGGITPRQDYSSDCSQAPIKRALTFTQGGSQQLGWTFTQGTTAKDLSAATLITFLYSPTSRAWSQVITGAVDVATNGSVLVTFTPAQLNTNTATLGAFDWLLEVTDGANANLAYAYGKLNLITDPAGGVTNTFPTTTTTVDWSTVAAYTKTYPNGPVRPGSGVNHTTNTDGSITFTVTATTDTTFTNYLAGDTEAVVTGSARSGSNILSIGSTITRDTELVAATQAIGTAYAAADVTVLGVATDSFAPITVTIAAASNAAMAGATAKFLPLAGGTMTGPVNFGAFTQTVARLSGSDTPSSGADGSITLSSSHVKLYPGSDGFAGGEVQIYNDDIEQTPEMIFHAPLNSATPVFDMHLEVKTNLTVGGSITEGGTALSGKYAPKTQTWPMDCNTTLLPTNVLPWVVTSWGPFDTDVTLTKLYAKVMFGSETALVHVCEMATNAATYTTNNSITADANGVYDTSFTDATLGAGNTLFFMLDGTAYSPLASNINVHIDGTRQYVNP